jgi:hypothetical protein
MNVSDPLEDKESPFKKVTIIFEGSLFLSGMRKREITSSSSQNLSPLYVFIKITVKINNQIAFIP